MATADDFRRLALSLKGAEAGSHMGAEDFRVGGHIFATLAHVQAGFGNLMLSPDQQQAFISEAPDVLLPVPGGWGRMGATHIRLSATEEATLEGALRAAWKRRIDNNKKSTTKRRPPTRQAS